MYVELPDFCPHCGKSVEPILVSQNIVKGNESQCAELCWKCPNGICSRLFLSSSELSVQNGNAYYLLSQYQLIPTYCPPIDFADEVDRVSPQFSEIYRQANRAENAGLNEIAGVGYRRALEFLLKDYCVYIRPEKEDDIKKEFLSQVVQKFVDREEIKQIATVALWLGNDESHYVKKT
ncbi:hypothetical protein C0431_05530 [bacterium]|nr:hypothetical protein [bacterium]